MKLEYVYQLSESENIYPFVTVPWSNVAHYDETREPVEDLAWLLLPGGVLTVGGALVLPLVSVPLGLVMLVPGVAMATIGTIQLIISPETSRYNPEGKPMKMPTERPQLVKEKAEDEESESEVDEESKDSDVEKSEGSEETESEDDNSPFF